MNGITRSVVAAGAVLLPACVAGQTCSPSTTSHEADLFAIRSLSLAMARGTAVQVDAPGTVRAGVEAVWLPRIDSATATPTACRPGKGPENVNALAVAARARLTVALPAGASVELSWLPPVQLNGMRGSIVGLALNYARRFTNDMTLSARLHATTGHVDGPFTCPASALSDPSSECHGGTLSHDRLEPNITGGDVAANWTPGRSHTSWYAGAGYSRLTPRFQVHFLNQAGSLDTTRVLVDLNRVALFAGVTHSIASRWRASGELYATTRDGVTGRVVFDRVIRRGH